MLPFWEASLKHDKNMKTYITPHTECTEMHMLGTIMGGVLLESGEGSKTNPGSVDPGKDLAPRRVF